MKITRFSLLIATCIISSALIGCASDSALDQFWSEDAGNGLANSGLNGAGLGPGNSGLTGEPQINIGNGNDGVGDVPGGWGQDADYIDGFGPRIKGVDFQPVYFQYDQNSIVQSEMSKVETVAQYLLDHPEAGVVIEGYCDERGTDEYNRALGERRAQSALFVLLDYGIDQSRLKTNSYGEERPANPGHEESAWTLNRRDEFIPCMLKK